MRVHTQHTCTTFTVQAVTLFSTKLPPQAVLLSAYIELQSGKSVQTHACSSHPTLSPQTN